MNIESANLSSLAPSVGTVENASAPVLAGAGVVSEGFSGALVTQIGLLSNIQTGDSLPLQTPDIVGLQSANGSQGAVGLPVGSAGTQDFAASLGNDLPLSYKTKDDVSHEAALAAVTDTLKYITGTTPGEQAAEAAQNMKGMVATAAQNMKDVVAMAVPAQQNMKDSSAPVVSVEQNTTAVVVDVVQSIKGAVVMDAATQMSRAQSNDKSDKKKVEDEAQITGVDDTRSAEALVAAVILPAIMPVEQGKAAPVPTDAAKEDGLLSFIKPSTGDAKSNQAVKVPDNVLQSEAVFRQPVQEKQDFNLKYFENAGQTEKTGRVEQQVLSLEGEKPLSRVGSDVTALNRPIVENKVDIPAITKPLSHLEWNKDLGERIVWMSSKAIPSAEIRLNPEHLGPISVRVNVADDQASVVFTAQHAATREALESSIPKLREMMGAQQLNLAEVSVSQGTASDQGRSQSQSFAQTADSRGQQGATGAVIDGVDDVEQEIESGRAVVSKGLLSLYA
ncbi:MAG TPA: flagellar hook-length control protein FliK [Methylobacter sp.]|jgi:flagellar hook-length control protein FliK